MGTKLLANYLRKDKIVVLAVHPGWMRTDMGGSNADLDPYETACKLAEMFKNINSTENPIFIDNNGDAFMWLIHILLKLYLIIKTYVDFIFISGYNPNVKKQIMDCDC